MANEKGAPQVSVSGPGIDRLLQKLDKRLDASLEADEALVKEVRELNKTLDKIHGELEHVGDAAQTVRVAVEAVITFVRERKHAVRAVLGNGLTVLTRIVSQANGPAKGGGRRRFQDGETKKQPEKPQVPLTASIAEVQKSKER